MAARGNLKMVDMKSKRIEGFHGIYTHTMRLCNRPRGRDAVALVDNQPMCQGGRSWF